MSEIRGSAAILSGRNLARQASGGDSATFVARPGSHIDDPVARCRDVHVVLDDDDGIASVHQGIELLHQPFHV